MMGFQGSKGPRGIETFSFCAKTYLANVCEWIEKLMGLTLKSYETPMATGDHHESDDSGYLNSDDHSRYRMLIGCAQWSIILGRIDVTFAVPSMVRFTAAPKEGHLKRMLRVFGYLKAYLKYGIMVDPGE